MFNYKSNVSTFFFCVCVSVVRCMSAYALGYVQIAS